MNAAITAIAWFVWLVFAIFCLNGTGHIRAMIAMFPEGWRWWVKPLHYVALCQFAAVVLLNPITGAMR